MCLGQIVRKAVAETVPVDIAEVLVRIIVVIIALTFVIVAVVGYLISTLLVETIKFFERYKKWRKEHPIDKEE